MTPTRGDVTLEVVKGSAAPQPDLTPAAGIPLPLLQPEGDEVSLREYLDVLLAGRWIVGVATAVALALGGAYAFLAAPVYRSDALVQVEDKKSMGGLLGDLSSVLGEASPAETEIEILRSRALVGAAVRELRLDVRATPKRFPFIGGAVARHRDPDRVAGAVLGIRRYGWGGERIAVDRLEVPAALVGKPLTLVAGEGDRFRLLDPDRNSILEGEVGKAAAGAGVEVFVSELRARPGLEFVLVRRDRDEAIAALQDDLKIAEKGKKTGILSLTLDGRDPREIAAILDSLSQAYVRKNVERRSAEAEKTLEFLGSQLPSLRAGLDAAERELETYQAHAGSVDVTLEGKAAIDRAVDIEKAAAELKLQHAELRQRFTEEHPALVAIAQKLKRLDAERDAIEARLRKLPANELESVRRARDVKVANEMYLAVLNKTQELKVVKEGTIGNVRILDSAIVPVKPVSPRKGAVLALSLLLGLAAGVAGAFGRRALDQGVEDPDALERALGIAVSASVPHSATQSTDEHAARADRRVKPLLAATAPKDLAVESLRSLRTSLQFALVEAPSSVVAIGGPAPGVGKSFIVANLAHLLGETGKKVLVVDADLRRGHLHQYFRVERGLGLSDAIAGEVPLDQACRATRSPNVSILSTGTIPPNPAELLGSDRFQRVLADLAARHDITLIDTPPVLAVTDAALVGRRAGVNLLVIRAGQHPVREIAAAVRQLGRNGVRVSGIVMNDVQLERGLGRRNAYHYQYTYE
ncbi:MAG TPA: polysaccharide biosynthesis tyrosine autokinase [Anaeromyxobacter sp.]